jgi:hypothetical protein
MAGTFARLYNCVMQEVHPLFEQVAQFVAKQTAFPIEQISPETSLAHDLGMSGDDAEAFFTAFVEKFDLDPDSLRTIDFGRRFGREGEFFWSACAVAIGIVLTLLVTSAFGLSIYLSGPLALPIVCLCLYLICKTTFAKRRPEADDITLDDLVRAAERKKWPAPPSAEKAAN